MVFLSASLIRLRRRAGVADSPHRRSNLPVVLRPVLDLRWPARVLANAGHPLLARRFVKPDPFVAASRERYRNVSTRGPFLRRVPGWCRRNYLARRALREPPGFVCAANRCLIEGASTAARLPCSTAV